MELKKSKKYDLERSRPQRFLLSLLSVIIIMMIISALPFALFKIVELQDSYDEDFIEEMNIDFEEEEKMVAATQTVVQEEVTEIIKPVETVTETIDPEEITVNQESVKEQIAQAENPEEKQEEAEETKPAQEELEAKPIARPDQEDLEIAEQLPEYPGGMSELVTWLTKTIKYPQSAIDRKIKGEVQVSFIIEKDGSLSHIEIYKSAHPLIDYEALRVARMMPKWKPGKRKGKVCRTFFVIPIVFDPIKR